MNYDIDQLPVVASNPGKSLYLLGQSVDGPVNQPVYINSLSSAESFFVSGNLLDAYIQVKDIPDINVYLMRITGNYARTSLLGEINNEVIPVIKFRSIYGGERYNSIHIYTKVITQDGVDQKALIIESPDSDTLGTSYILSEYENLHELIYTINMDTRLKRNWVYVFSDYAYVSPDCLADYNTTPAAMAGGEDGLDTSKDDLYLALETSYSILEGREIDIICPYPSRFDDHHPAFYYGSGNTYGTATYGSEDFLALVNTDNNQPVTFHEQLIQFCQSQERFGVTTHGVIGLRELQDIDHKNPYYLSRLLNATAFSNRYGLGEYRDGAWFDKGFYISILAQDFIFQDDLEANGCALYAGLLASLAPNETATNKPIPDGIDLRFELDAGEARDLSSIGAVAARRSVKRGIVITNGITAALPDSPFYSVQNVRMVQYTLYILNQTLDQMIGKTYVPVATLQEIDRKVKDALTYCVSLGVIKTFDYDIQFDTTTEEVAISLQLMPGNSIEFISASARLDFSFGGNA